MLNLYLKHRMLNVTRGITRPGMTREFFSEKLVIKRTVRNMSSAEKRCVLYLALPWLLLSGTSMPLMAKLSLSLVSVLLCVLAINIIKYPRQNKCFLSDLYQTTLYNIWWNSLLHRLSMGLSNVQYCRSSGDRLSSSLFRALILFHSLQIQRV